VIAPAGGYGVAGAGGDPGDLRLITIPISHYCEKARWALVPPTGAPSAGRLGG
jgi:hypothetical protein